MKTPQHLKNKTINKLMWINSLINLLPHGNSQERIVLNLMRQKIAGG